MSKIKLSKQFIQNTCKTALNEDLFPSGDITSDLISNNSTIKAKLISNDKGIIAGLEFAKNTFKLIDKKIKFVSNKKDGSRIKKGDIYVATDVFPEEPVKKNDPIRKLKNVLFSAHRAGALEQAFFEMGDIVLKDMNLILKKMPPKFCKRAQRKTVNLLASKPVAIN